MSQLSYSVIFKEFWHFIWVMEFIDTMWFMIPLTAFLVLRDTFVIFFLLFLLLENYILLFLNSIAKDLLILFILSEK